MGQNGENSEEVWDLYNENRLPTGKTHRRGEPMKDGEYHLVVHVCIFNSKNQLLIQQRQPFKKGWPNMWDLTVGGSALAGDTSQKAAERETFEEIGLSLDLSNVRPHFTINFENGFDDYYLIEKEVHIEDLKLQEEEVQRVKWVDKEELLKMEQEGLMIPYYFLDKLFEIKNYYGGRLLDKKHDITVGFAELKNVPSWMNLVDLVRWNFPGLETEEKIEAYQNTVIKNIERKSAICALDGRMAVGILLFSPKYNMLCCMAVHPEYRRQKIGTRMVNLMLENLDRERDITVETFRQGDEKGLAPRAFYQSLGFEEGELCCFEEGYPVQKFILKGRNASEEKEQFRSPHCHE